ncbi:hypothetical protein PR048_012865 [Dryococelus australis]|uniref:Integrase zinc-binding domain-containing protein n=1 Tax=Dryococelus australis TaxID=614101 RepID=A0ABQ9HQK7_9NEOP|nr:hypothetical protein PR048_012865 [Dryococelus australis]
MSLEAEGEIGQIVLKALHSLLQEKLSQLASLDELVFDNLLAVGKIENKLDAELNGNKEQHCKGKYKLPKIELKSYGGDLTEWLGFWSQFSKIDADEGLDNSVESCLTEELLRAWQRSGTKQQGENMLYSLMDFLKKEVEQEERISLTLRGVHLNRFEGTSRGTWQKRVTLQQPQALLTLRRAQRQWFVYSAKHSFITKEIAADMGYQYTDKEEHRYCLFGCKISNKVLHEKFQVTLGHLHSNNDCCFEVIDQVCALWDLNKLGMEYPGRLQTKENRISASWERFEESLKWKNGQYEVELPWKKGHDPLPTNIEVTQRRLKTLEQKLNKLKVREVYSEVFKDWKRKEIIEVKQYDQNEVHYLPHRPICLSEKYRDFAHFVWKNDSGELTIWRHTRVVSGVTSSPFLLGAVIKLHLKKILCERRDGVNSYSEEIIGRLQRDFYVDNCVTMDEDSSIPRYILKKQAKLSLHIFTDASQHTYTVVCCSFEVIDQVEDLHFWSDSTSVISWIQRDEQWGVVVYNRVQEIRLLSKRSTRIYIPGTMNPTDLASRPDWLRCMLEEWPFGTGEVDEDPINLELYEDDCGTLSLRTMISEQKDRPECRHPVVLPAKHPVVKRLIYSLHVQSNHCGVQGLFTQVRKRYWILKGRSLSWSVINNCVVCWRFSGPHVEQTSPPLPEDQNSTKVWMCIFTCALYQAVHLEVASSLSIYAFILALRRFIARHGRPTTIYSDNGTKFLGTENAFSMLDWEEIMCFSLAHHFVWKFNPPTAALWVGWWECLIGLLKTLLRRTLGRALLNFDELSTIICDCEGILNSRPFTCISEYHHYFVALTPAMFLKDINEMGVPDCDQIDSVDTKRWYRYLQSLCEDLRRRFRIKYLGLLSTKTQVNGGNSVSRVARLNTAWRVITCPIQYIYHLEGREQVYEAPDQSPGGRREKAKVGEAISEEEEFTSEVPQGSMLCHLLFTIMVNDMTCVWGLGEKSYCLQTIVLYMLRLRIGKNKMKINVKKTKVVRFTRKKMISRDMYRWEGQEIEEAAEYNYLGIVLQGDLRWKKQVERVVAKGRRALDLLEGC